MKAVVRRILAALLVVSGAMHGCSRPESDSASSDRVVAASTADSTAAAERARRSSQPRYSLGIVGYNYTETAIDDYLVNGTGAFNLSVGSENSGGGSTVCCFGWVPAMKLPMPVRVEWTRDRKTWCRQIVMLTDGGPPEPTTLEVHIYPDRHVEVAITDDYSAPRLKLKRAGNAFRVGLDVRREEILAIQADRQSAAECREGEFPPSDATMPARVRAGGANSEMSGERKNPALLQGASPERVALGKVPRAARTHLGPSLATGCTQ